MLLRWLLHLFLANIPTAEFDALPSSRCHGKAVVSIVDQAYVLVTSAVVDQCPH